MIEHSEPRWLRRRRERNEAIVSTVKFLVMCGAFFVTVFLIACKLWVYPPAWYVVLMGGDL